MPTGKADKPMAIPSNPANELQVFECAVATLYTDDCGRFPIRAQSGNQYIMVAYHVKANVMLIKGFQTRHDQHRIPAYNAIMQRLKNHGVTVANQVLYNKASEAYKAAITNKWNCTYQLVLPDMSFPDPPDPHDRRGEEEGMEYG